MYKQDNGSFIDTNQFGNYYYPKEPNQPNYRKIYVLIIFLILTALVLLIGGYLTPIDKEEKYQELLDIICQKATIYVSREENKKKLNGMDVPGRVIYIRIIDLVEAKLIGANLIDYRTNEEIPLLTDIKLEVIAEDTILCRGFAWPEDDRIPPVITLIGEDIIYLNKGDTFVEPGYYSFDNRDGDITNKVTITGHINNNIPGTYYRYYTVRDRAGNQSKQVERKIIVK